MELAYFLKTLSTQSSDHTYPIIQLIADSPPFFLWHALRHAGLKFPLYTIDVQQADMNELRARLMTSFLGSSRRYLLGGLDMLSAKKSQLLVEFLQEYEGPHTLIVTPAKPYKLSNKSSTIVLNEKCKKSDLQSLVSLLTKERAVMRHLPPSLSVDEACKLIYYFTLGGQAFSKSSWKSYLFATTPKLFILSQYFFAQKPDKFFATWNAVTSLYPLPFWLSFWSDQLWRAYFYVYAKRAQENEKAKQYAFRLPFSFTKQDWRLYGSGQALIDAHNVLYEIDFVSKNGVKSSGLDLLYSGFFLSKNIDICH